MKINRTILLPLILSASLATQAAPEVPEPGKPAPEGEQPLRERKPQEPGDRPQEPGARPQHEPKKELRTWLGVATSELHPTLRQHLDLKEGFGIQVSHVQAESPAALVGLKEGDVLTNLDNQILTTPDQLSILVRAKKKGDAIELTYMRKAVEQKVSVTLGEQEMPVMEHRPGRFPHEFIPEQFRDWQQEMQRQHQRMMPEGQRFEMERNPDNDRKKEPNSRENSFSRKSTARSQSSVNISNDLGSVVITQHDGKGHIMITGREGKQIYNGTYDVSRGLKGLPENAQDHLREMKVDHIEMLNPAPDPIPVQPKPDGDEKKEPEKPGEVL